MFRYRLCDLRQHLWLNLKNWVFKRNRRGLETCPQAKMSKSGHAIFFSFLRRSERRVSLSAESKILASTFGHFHLYRLVFLTKKGPFLIAIYQVISSRYLAFAPPARFSSTNFLTVLIIVIGVIHSRAWVPPCIMIFFEPFPIFMKFSTRPWKFLYSLLFFTLVFFSLNFT